MTIEILADGGVRIHATLIELRTLGDNVATALHRGRAHAPFLTAQGVTEFLIAAEQPVSDIEE